MANIKDVAERAGVSFSLVSHYLNGRPGVGKDSKRRIDEAIKELNYCPSAMARSLVKRRSDSIGVIVTHISNPFLFELFEGIEEAAGNYNVTYSSATANKDVRKRYFDFYKGGRVDALIVYGSGTEDEEFINELARFNTPIVLIESDIENENVSKILIDNAAAGKDVTVRLVWSERKNLLFMDCFDDIRAIRDRKESFIRLAEKGGAEYRIVNIDPENTSPSRHEVFKLAYNEMMKIIEEGNIPDGIFASGDIIGYGAMQALTEKGYRVPEDVSIIGFNDESGREFGCTRRLSSMRQPLKEAGKLAVEACFDMINKKGPVKKVLSTIYVDNGTCSKKK